MYIGVPVYINTIVRIYPIFFFPEFAHRGEGKKKKRKREEPRWNKGKSFENGMGWRETEVTIIQLRTVSQTSE